MKKILIADHYRGSLEQMHLAMKQNGVLGGISLLSLSSFKESDLLPREALSLSFHQKLLERKDAFRVYGGMFDYPSFVDEILKFAGECVLYGIGEDDLPGDTKSEMELKQIVGLALQEDLPEKRNVRMEENLGKRLQELKKNSEVVCIPSFASDVYSAGLKKILAENVTVLEEDRRKAQKCRRYADSDRQEMEAVVQDLIAKRNVNPDMRFNIILTNVQSQMPLLDTVMRQYHMAYSAVHQTHELKLFQRWCGLAALSLNMDDMDAFRCAVSMNGFDRMPSGKAMAFMRTSMTSYELDEDLPERMKDTCFASFSEDVRQGMEETEKYLEMIQDKLDQLRDAQSAQDKAAAAYEIVRHASILQKKDRDALMEGAQLRNVLSNCLAYLHTDEDLKYLIAMLKEKTGSAMVLASDNVIVTDIRHPADRADQAYIIGCCEDYYPGFSIRNGLFDEAYIRKVKKFPDMEERLTLYEHEMEWVQYSGDRIVYSMAASDTSGKERNWYVGLTDIKDHQKWKLVTLKPMAKDPCAIDEEDVQAELLDNGVITTSVTASEDYFKCPMQWFYKHGMKISQKTPLGLDAAAMGTLWHQMMEDAFKESEDPKTYCNKDEAWIRSYLKPQFDVLRDVLPALKTEVDLTEEKMVRNTVRLFAWLSDMEGSTSYVPKEAELGFDHVPVTEDGKVQLKGRIDRVDEFAEHEFRIIDYKSGNDKYSPKMFADGLQTQLVSYLYVYQLICEGKGREVNPAGGWYCHLNPVQADAPGMETEGRGKKMEVHQRTFDAETCRKEEYKNRKMPGVLLDQDQKDGLDASGGTYSALKSCLPANEDYQYMDEMLNAIYSRFYQGVESGSFPADPVEGGCSFCPFKPICRFKGREKKPESLLVKEENNAI